MKEILKATPLLITVVTLTFFFGCGRPEEAGHAEKAIPVIVGNVEARDVVHRLHRVGSLEARESVMLKSEAEERVTGIFFEEGDPAETGQLLVKLNDAKTKAKLQELESRLRQMELQLANSRKTMTRKEPLVKKNLVSKQEFDDLKTKIEIEKATIKEIRAQLSHARELFKDTEIRSPFAGITSERLVSVGDFLKRGDPVVRVVQLDPLEISFRVDEKYKTRLYINQPVEVTVAAYPERKFEGKIYFISPDIEITTRTFLVKGRIANEEDLLNPGMFANASIITEIHKNALVVPWESLVQLEDEVYVYGLNDGKARKVPVKLLLISADTAEVSGNLQPGQKVIREGKYAVQDGSKVEVKKLKKE